MKLTKPRWFPVVDEVTITFVLLAGVFLLLATMEMWGH